MCHNDDWLQSLWTTFAIGYLFGWLFDSDDEPSDYSGNGSWLSQKL